MTKALEEKNKDLSIQIIEAVNKNDTEKMKSFFSEDFVAHLSSRPDSVNREEYIQVFIEFRKAFNPLKFTIKEQIADKDLVAVYWQVKGKHTGDYTEFPASQSKIDFSGMFFRRYADGKAVEEWQVNDIFSLLKQIGLSFNYII